MQWVLWSSLYQSHMSISSMVRIESVPSWCAVLDLGVFKAQLCETGGVCWCRRCMVMNVQLNNAWIKGNLQLPWKFKLATVGGLARFLLQLLQTTLLLHLQMKIQPRKGTSIDELLMNWWKKCVCKIVKFERICEILRLDLRKWDVIMRNSYD